MRLAIQAGQLNRGGYERETGVRLARATGDLVWKAFGRGAVTSAWSYSILSTREARLRFISGDASRERM
jgi:hypothetical protein